MLEKIKIECPACGADPKDQKKDNSEMYSQIFLKKEPQLISKLLEDNHMTDRYSSNNQSHQSPKDNFNIKISSPKFSPFFPSKNQKKESEVFLSPLLKGGQF